MSACTEILQGLLVCRQRVKKLRVALSNINAKAESMQNELKEQKAAQAACKSDKERALRCELLASLEKAIGALDKDARDKHNRLSFYDQMVEPSEAGTV